MFFQRSILQLTQQHRLHQDNHISGYSELFFIMCATIQPVVQLTLPSRHPIQTQQPPRNKQAIIMFHTPERSDREESLKCPPPPSRPGPMVVDMPAYLRLPSPPSPPSLAVKRSSPTSLIYFFNIPESSAPSTTKQRHLAPSLIFPSISSHDTIAAYHTPPISLRPRPKRMREFDEV
jgi:hypothetical protein